LSIPNAPLGEYKDQIAKQCALIANQEVLDLAFMLNNQELITYYLKVKEELQSL
jgi:hypothetical protein